MKILTKLRNIAIARKATLLVLTLAIALALTLVATPAATAQTYSVIHTFTGGQGGAQPSGGVTLRGGVLYGTAEYGGYNNNGLIYQLTRGSWNFSSIFLFPGDGSGGVAPLSGVVFAPDGHFYGTIAANDPYYVIFYDLLPPVSVCKTANCGWKQNILDTFGKEHGLDPQNGKLVWDQQGNAYGITKGGGSFGFGTVFELTKSGNNWSQSPIYSFSGGNDGWSPLNGVFLDNHGNLFGTTYLGGSAGEGVIFELTFVPGVGWKQIVIHTVGGGSEGESPVAGVIGDSSGNLYGSTLGGGSGGGGTIFELSPSGNTWTYKVLYSFSGAGGPVHNLNMDAAGNLYGATVSDGAYGKGNVFKLTHTPNGWVYTSLYDFTGGSDGSNPLTDVAIDSDGTLYGTANIGGDTSCNPPNGCGVVWMIKP